MLEWFLTKLVGLIGPIENAINTKRKLSDNALQALSHALTETAIYLKRKEERNHELEEALAKYWAAAAIPMRHIDCEFAEMCQYKSEYWINPENWNTEHRDKQVTTLNEVSQKLRGLLNP